VLGNLVTSLVSKSTEELYKTLYFICQYQLDPISSGNLKSRSFVPWEKGSDIIGAMVLAVPSAPTAHLDDLISFPEDAYGNCNSPAKFGQIKESQKA
jgi:hypothetical protein